MTEGTRSYDERSPRRVWVYTLDRVYTGVTHLHKSERLLDYLNDTIARDRFFLPLTDPRVRERWTGAPESVIPFVAVNVRQILLAWEAGPTPQSRPNFVPKRPIAVRLQLEGQVTVQGKVHCAPAESLLNLLNRRERFVPMTEVSLSPAGWEGGTLPTFAAVNKEYLVSAWEAEAMAGDASLLQQPSNPDYPNLP